MKFVMMSNILVFLEKTWCGNYTLAPTCSLCPRNNNDIYNNWCSGSCAYDEDINKCGEGNFIYFNPILVLIYCFET